MDWHIGKGKPAWPVMGKWMQAMSRTKHIRKSVEDELSFDPLVDASDISVKALNGDVTLKGTVPSYPQHVEAAAAAKRVAGVKAVHNHLAVVLPPGYYRDDRTLTRTTNDALALDVSVPTGVEATARNGNITLTGTVRYGTQRAAAVWAVAALPGVRNIKNHIRIRSDADPIDVTVHVQDALNRCSLIPDDSDVMVATSGNTVTLTGHVHTWAEHDAVMEAVWMAPGVYDVSDHLNITG